MASGTTRGHVELDFAVGQDVLPEQGYQAAPVVVGQQAGPVVFDQDVNSTGRMTEVGRPYTRLGRDDFVREVRPAMIVRDGIPPYPLPNSPPRRPGPVFLKGVQTRSRRGQTHHIGCRWRLAPATRSYGASCARRSAAACSR